MSFRFSRISSSRKVRFEPLEDRRMLAVLTVNSSDDFASNNDDGSLTLREAIAVVNDDFNPTIVDGDKLQIDDLNGTEPVGINDKIIFAPSVFGPGLEDTIVLNHGELPLNQVVNIEGPGASLLTIDASGSDPDTDTIILGNGSRHFYHSAYHLTDPVIISGLTLTGGDTSDSGGSITTFPFGPSGLVIENVIFDSNYSATSGGAIHASSDLQIISNTFISNKAGGRGGAIHTGGGSLQIELSTFDLNESNGNGGAISAGVNDDVIISSSSFTNNKATGTGRGGAVDIFSYTLLIETSTFSLNESATEGGAIHLTLPDSTEISKLSNVTVTENTANESGGGVYITDFIGPGYIVITDSNISNNKSTNGQGGGIYSHARGLEILSTLIAANESWNDGGGLYASLSDTSGNANSSISNSTFSGNKAINGEGGGIRQQGSNLSINSTTITDNIASTGGGVSAGNFTMNNTIVLGNKDELDAASNIEGLAHFSTNNLLGTGGSGGIFDGDYGNIVTSSNDPQLGPLLNNGGSTLSHLPQNGSLAIDNGSPYQIYSATDFDQRGIGFSRVLGGIIDIGAIETDGLVIPPPTAPTASGFADIVMLFDLSGSVGAEEAVKLFNKRLPAALDYQLREQGYVDNRYAIVGFGHNTFSNYYGFSSLIDDSLFSDVQDATTITSQLNYPGSTEDGWDAIEHAISEHDFREHAAVHFILITDQLRTNLNASLTSDDIPETIENESSVASLIKPVLDSKNATLTVVASAGFTTHSTDHVFGVLSSESTSHQSIEYVNSTASVLTKTFDESEDFNASGNTEDSYVRLAWNTGGSAWNINAISTSNSGLFTREFVMQVGSNIEIQETHSTNRIVESIDFGAATSPAFPDSAPSSVVGATISPSPTIYLASGSIPHGGDIAFQTAIEASNGNNIDIDFNLANGTYNVELFFAEIDTSDDRIFDVTIEGNTVLNNYNISEDRSKVTATVPDVNNDNISRLEVTAAENNTGVVKVFRVTVSDGVLSIDLEDAGGTQGPLINAVRILDAEEDWLLGDFNEDGSVDAADYTVWRDNLISVAYPHTSADHSGNGIIDAADYLIWVANYGISLQFLGDYNEDGAVDAADYTVWRDTLGNTVPAGTGADGSGNGTVDAADYMIWVENYGASPTVAPAAATTFDYVAAPPGDFNFDGTVDYDDYLLWESILGTTVPVGSGADANANGFIDLNDLGIWQAFNGLTTLPELIGDFNDDGTVNDDDLALWNAGDLTADANSDGLVDQLDYGLWLGNYGLIHASVWPTIVDPQGGGGGGNGAPFVSGFQLSESTGAGGSFDYATVVGSGEQLRTAPVLFADQISITFSHQVLITQNALQIDNLDNATQFTIDNFTYDPSTNTATWTFDSYIEDGRIQVRIDDSLVDLDGESLDGEYNNPWLLSETGSATFPTGDGVEGGDFLFRFTVLEGDDDHDNLEGGYDYTKWLSYEPGLIKVTTTLDEIDGDYSYGNMSLREAVQMANAATEPTTILLPEGRYLLDRNGTEAGDASYNDLNITNEVTIVGDGAGLSIIDVSGLNSNSSGRAFAVQSANSKLILSSVTIASGATQAGGLAVYIDNGGTLELYDSAIVNHTNYAGATAIYVGNANATIRRSVIANNDTTSNYSGSAIYAIGTIQNPSSLTIGDTIFAHNVQPGYGGSTNFGVKIGMYTSSAVTKVNEGNNLYDDASGGFFDTTPGTGDHLGTPDYIVTTVADTFDHADNDESLSLREAIDLANQASGQQEIWIPAWALGLTRDRATYGGGSTTDTDIAFGDLDISNSLKIRGVTNQTSVAWEPGMVDEVFDLQGDYLSGDNTVDITDYNVWDYINQNNLQFLWEFADGDDDGDVDQDDYDIWFENQGNTLDLIDVA